MTPPHVCPGDKRPNSRPPPDREDDTDPKPQTRRCRTLGRLVPGPGHCPVCPELSACLPDATLRAPAQPLSADKVPAELIPGAPQAPLASTADPAPTPPRGAVRGHAVQVPPGLP